MSRCFLVSSFSMGIAVSGLILLMLFFSSFSVAAQAENPPSGLVGDVQLRIDTFDEIERLFKALRFKVVNQRSQDSEGVQAYSDQLVRQAYRLPGLFEVFSPRSLYPQSRARPEIWEYKARYDFLLNQMLDQLEETHELLEQGRLKEAGLKIDSTAKGCRRCHKHFRYR